METSCIAIMLPFFLEDIGPFCGATDTPVAINRSGIEQVDVNEMHATWVVYGSAGSRHV